MIKKSYFKTLESAGLVGFDPTTYSYPDIEDSGIDVFSLHSRAIHTALRTRYSIVIFTGREYSERKRS
jgi:hypothetical protein